MVGVIQWLLLLIRVVVIFIIIKFLYFLLLLNYLPLHLRRLGQGFLLLGQVLQSWLLVILHFLLVTGGLILLFVDQFIWQCQIQRESPDIFLEVTLLSFFIRPVDLHLLDRLSLTVDITGHPLIMYLDQVLGVPRLPGLQIPVESRIQHFGQFVETGLILWSLPLVVGIAEQRLVHVAHGVVTFLVPECVLASIPL